MRAARGTPAASPIPSTCGRWPRPPSRGAGAGQGAGAVPRAGRDRVAATLRMLRERPAVVVGFGGYPAIPAMAAAWLTRVRALIHEQNGVLGRVNRLFARRVDAVACGTWPTELPSGVAGIHTGNPVRAAILVARRRALHAARRLADEPSGLRRQPGRAGAVRCRARRRRASAARSCATTCAWRSRPGPRISTACRGLCRARRPRRGRALLRRHAPPPDRGAACHRRAGASSVADICVVGRPAIYIPYAAAVRDEQTANARGPVDAEAAALMPESKLTPEAGRHHRGHPDPARRRDPHGRGRAVGLRARRDGTACRAGRRARKSRPKDAT
jgi:UDP-N-acetylglucosamine--N-acetylmuramyl-(pentapeptide) pyrophosphoryl-undecaprenol N-acetylglucosamine transferase